MGTLLTDFHLIRGGALHRANGGYDGYDRELHRVTIAGVPDLYLNAAA